MEEGGSSDAKIEGKVTMHNPFTRGITSLYLSCHVPDHANTRVGDEAGSADIHGTPGTLIMQVFNITLLLFHIQIKPGCEGGLYSSW